MNLETLVGRELWLAVSNTYKAENYSGAILDAMHYLTEVLRTKTGLDGDGASLVGQALGGDSPRLRVNKLQTQTEKDVQKGIEQLLRGLYVAIRNPRSHEHVEDTKDTADALIHFISFLIGVIDQAKEPFTIPDFLNRVFDKDFYANREYAELLAADIPPAKRLDTLIEIYRRKLEGDLQKLPYAIRAIAAQLSTEQVEQYLQIVSDELRTTEDEATLRMILAILPAQLWPRIHKVARLRIENKLLLSIKSGEVQGSGKVSSGSLGTWARDFLPHFAEDDRVRATLIEKLEDDDGDDVRYVAKFFIVVLPRIFSTPQWIERCVRSICRSVRAENAMVESQLVEHITGFPDAWQRALADGLADLTDPDRPLTWLADGTPFLSQPPEEEEDLPF